MEILVDSAKEYGIEVIMDIKNIVEQSKNTVVTNWKIITLISVGIFIVIVTIVVGLGLFRPKITQLQKKEAEQAVDIKRNYMDVILQSKIPEVEGADLFAGMKQKNAMRSKTNKNPVHQESKKIKTNNQSSNIPNPLKR